MSKLPDPNAIEIIEFIPTFVNKPYIIIWPDGREEESTSAPFRGKPKKSALHEIDGVVYKIKELIKSSGKTKVLLEFK